MRGRNSFTSNFLIYYLNPPGKNKARFHSFEVVYARSKLIEIALGHLRTFFTDLDSLVLLILLAPNVVARLSGDDANAAEDRLCAKLTV